MDMMTIKPTISTPPSTLPDQILNPPPGYFMSQKVMEKCENPMYEQETKSHLSSCLPCKNRLESSKVQNYKCRLVYFGAEYT